MSPRCLILLLLFFLLLLSARAGDFGEEESIGDGEDDSSSETKKAISSIFKASKTKRTISRRSPKASKIEDEENPGEKEDSESSVSVKEDGEDGNEESKPLSSKKSKKLKKRMKGFFSNDEEIDEGEKTAIESEDSDSKPRAKRRGTKKASVENENDESESVQKTKRLGLKKSSRKSSEKDESGSHSDEEDGNERKIIKITPPEEICVINPEAESSYAVKLSCGLGQLGATPGMDRAFYKDPRRYQKEVSTTESGAIRSNQLYHDGTSEKWQAAHQLAGADYVQAGLVQQDEHLIQRGLFALNWALQHLSGRTEFSMVGGDPSSRMHLSLFFEAAGRSALLLRSAGQCEDFVKDTVIPFLSSFGKWAKNPSEDASSMKGLGDRSHIRLARAAGFAYLSNLVEEESEELSRSEEASQGYADATFAMQEDDGTYREDSIGFDATLQSSSIMLCARLMAATRRLTLREQARTSLESAVKKLRDMMEVDDEGRVSFVGPKTSSKADSDSESNAKSSGKKREPDMKPVIHGLFYASALLGSEEIHASGRQAANFKYKLTGDKEVLQAEELSWEPCSEGTESAAPKRSSKSRKARTKKSSRAADEETDVSEDGDEGSPPVKRGKKRLKAGKQVKESSRGVDDEDSKPASEEETSAGETEAND